MPDPNRTENASRRNRLIRWLAPAIQDIPRDQVRRAPYAITADIPNAQQNALVDHALDLGGPPGTVIGRKIATEDGHTVEVLIGWERIEAFTDRDAFPRATTLPIGVIDCNAAEAAFYAIEYAQQDQRASGLITSALLYAKAANIALEHFGKPDKPWSIQTLANALCIARPTLSNRLRLLKGLQPKTHALLQSGQIKPQFAKTLLAEPNAQRQENLAEQAAKGMMSSRALYKLVHPGYEPPKLVAQPRGKPKQRLGDAGLMQRTLTENYGTGVDITLDKHAHKGTVEFRFDSLSILKGLIEKLEADIEHDSIIKGSLMMQVNNAQEANTLLMELGANSDPELD
ncbi:MAG: hypothetical protein AB8B81_17935 [Halioglobus sp.]